MNKGQPVRDFKRVFKQGTKYKDEHSTYTVKLVDLAPVTLPTGKIFAADPFTFHRVEPFERTVKKGTYAITASIAKVAPLKKGRAQERVGAAMLRIAKGEPHGWINATRKGQKLAKLEPDYFYGYGVDAGTGCFCDVTAATALAMLNEIEFANENWEGWLMAKISKGMLSSKQAWGTGTAITVPATKANVVAFSSGWGDGFYGSYWGLSKKGEPLCLVTDFGVYPAESADLTGTVCAPGCLSVMSRIALCAALVGLSLVPAARADQLGATQSMPLVETSHTVDIKIENGVATYTVRRMFKNPGTEAEQVELVIGLPYGAAATGLRIKAKDKWFTGELMEREAAAKMYAEMTGYGPFQPKDPALLAWMWADTLSLQVFPVMPKTTSTVEYTLTAPTRYMGGRYFVSYPRVAKLTAGEEPTPRSLPLAVPVVNVHFGWGDAKTKLLVDGREVKRDTPIALVPPPHQDWEDHVEIDRAASYVASRLEIPSSSHTEKTFATAKLNLDIRHTYKSDLRVELITPQNESISVFSGGGGGTNDIRGEQTVTLPAGTTAAGAWRLVVSDHVGLDAGTLDRWSLTIGEGKDKTLAAATDTPMFIPDAPANATEAGVATISVDPPPIAQLVGRLGKVVASNTNAFSRLELDIAPQLVPTPKKAQVVFVIDTSYSMHEEGVNAQLDLVAAYATHLPDAEIEIVTFRRHADRAFGRFVPAKQLDQAIAAARKANKFVLANGSNLDEGAKLSAALLADRAGPRRVVLATDELVKASLTNTIALAAFQSLSADTVVHVIVPKIDNDDRASLTRRDEADFAQLATKHHGIFADLGGFPAKTIKELAPTVLELVRPTRIENAEVTGFEIEGKLLHEGDGVRLMINTEGRPAPDRVTLTGRLWSDPVNRELVSSAQFSVATAAFVFGGDEHQGLSPAEQMTVAMMGRAVSPVTSYVAAEPGTRPSPIGLGRGFGTIGSGSYGSVGYGMGGGGGSYLPELDWSKLIDVASCVASQRPSAPWSITLTVETTREEVVDVTAQTPGGMARCLAEAAWNLKLDPGRFSADHDTYTFELSGDPVP